MSLTRPLRAMAVVGLGLLVGPLWLAPPAEAASVELMRWQAPDLGPHVSSSFRLTHAYTDYYFGAQGPGPGPGDDAALGWVRVRVISSAEVVCTGVVVHPGRGLSDVFQTCDLVPGHHYDLDWFVDRPEASMVLYGRDDLASS